MQRNQVHVLLINADMVHEYVVTISSQGSGGGQLHDCKCDMEVLYPRISEGLFREYHDECVFAEHSTAFASS
jgi:hypothetical protein